MVRKFLGQLHNSASAWSFAATFLRAGVMIFILPLIVRTLSPEELGLWYVFLAVGTLAGLLDFGFSPTMTRAVGYVWGGAAELQSMGLKVLAEGEIHPPNYPLLSRLVATMAFYYRVLAGLVLVLMLTAGSWWIWRRTGSLPNHAALRSAWIFYSFATALNTVGNLWPTLLAGINGVRQAQQLTVLSLVANYLAIFLGLALHGGIWALILGQFVMGFLLRFGGKLCFQSLIRKDIGFVSAKLDRYLFETLWPMSWRNGLVSVASFAILNVNILVCSAYLGLAETASYGLSLQVAGFVASLSVIGVQVKFPEINQLRAQNRLEEIAHLFVGRMRLMILIYLAGALGAILAGDQLLLLIHSRTHLLSLPMLAVLLTFHFLEMHNHQYGTLIASENQMPVLVPFLVTGAGVVLCSLLLTPAYGLWGMVLSFGIVPLCYNHWWIVRRGIHGLSMTSARYWRLFFQLNRPS